jgi:hypothetical protein
VLSKRKNAISVDRLDGNIVEIVLPEEGKSIAAFV